MPQVSTVPSLNTAAKVQDDKSEVWRSLSQVVAIGSTARAFAAVRSDGSVVTWGKADAGGDSSSVQSELIGVVSLSSSAFSFTARKNDGTTVTWGNTGHTFRMEPPKREKVVETKVARAAAPATSRGFFRGFFGRTPKKN